MLAYEFADEADVISKWKICRELELRGGIPVGKDVETPSTMERKLRLEAVLRTLCRVDGCTPVAVRERVLSAFWVSERNRYVANPSAVTLGVFSKRSSFRGGNGAR